ncbi:TPA: hypothetical protein HA242_02445 [Candidatus Woesearchaeota archaeon]|nr:hypothetical protein [Candidatus Woesearchaeota archaeon]HIG92885.1 hypothetical protein [Candidatus Woesearchaeota archaeon]HIH12559.1 hypothetical protein [Candidatus Woesearchaeota archaeon]
MNSEQARLIRNYERVPTTRGSQIGLLMVMGYTKLCGRPLEMCEDKQIHAVARRLYQKALDFKLPPELSSEEQLRNQRKSFLARDYRAWADNLYEIFNIQPNQRDRYSPADLEAQLLE